VELYDVIVRTLAQHPDGLPKTEIDRAVVGRRALKVPALRGLVAEGRIVRTGTGLCGAPYRYVVADEIPAPGNADQRTEAGLGTLAGPPASGLLVPA
jgi:hypothetical protein